ncbi:hypothetical protein ACOSQ3_012766 [Xanthoceras sorbifolium]
MISSYKVPPFSCQLHNRSRIRPPYFTEWTVHDISLSDYIGVQPAKRATFVPHTAGRYSKKRFKKTQCPIVERLTNSLMIFRILKHAMAIIHLRTDLNPIQVIVDAVINTGVVRRQAVDISPLRHVNQAIYLLTTGARESAYRNIKTIAECLADELINAKKDEIERVAKANS